jgi:hypothetical protein
MIYSFERWHKMGHVRTFDIPDALYGPLQQQAQHAGKMPDEAVLAWFMSTVQRLTDDPLLQLAGSCASPVTDVRDRHDGYIGQSVMAE